mgnify:CR=1 FL=1
MGRESRVTSHESRTTILFLIILSLLITIPAWAQKAGRKLNVISGEVSAVSKDFIAVVYRSDKAKGSEEEIALPVANDAVVEHKQSLSQIGIGDMVDVEYEEYTEETPDGPKSKRVAVAVRFLRAAPKQPEPFTFEAEEDETGE